MGGQSKGGPLGSAPVMVARVEAKGRPGYPWGGRVRPPGWDQVTILADVGDCVAIKIILDFIQQIIIIDLSPP